MRAADTFYPFQQRERERLRESKSAAMPHTSKHCQTLQGRGRCLCQALGPACAEPWGPASRGHSSPPGPLPSWTPGYTCLISPPSLLVPGPSLKPESVSRLWAPWTDISIPSPGSSSMQWRNYAPVFLLLNFRNGDLII